MLLQRPDSLNHGFAVWDSSVGFARFLAQSPKTAGDIAGKAVLEFGCGCGLLGVVFHRLRACSVMLTDLPDVVDNAAACMAANGVSARLFTSSSRCRSSAVDGPAAAAPVGASDGVSSFDGVFLIGHSWGDEVTPLFGVERRVGALHDVDGSRAAGPVQAGAGSAVVSGPPLLVKRAAFCRPYDILIGASVVIFCCFVRRARFAVACCAAARLLLALCLGCSVAHDVSSLYHSLSRNCDATPRCRDGCSLFSGARAAAAAKHGDCSLD